MPCSHMHVCRAECAPCKLPFIAYLLPLDKQQQILHQRILIHTLGRGAGPAPHRILSKLLCLYLSIQAATGPGLRRLFFSFPRPRPA
eukprot:1156351-Pelagomonas_calceolata.AAC.11